MFKCGILQAGHLNILAARIGTMSKMTVHIQVRYGSFVSFFLFEHTVL